MAIVFKTILPTKPWKTLKRSVKRDITAEVEKIGLDMEFEFFMTTFEWERKVKFELLTEVTDSRATVMVDTDDEIYGYVNNGTKPHKIPKIVQPGQKRLAFMTTGFQPKTKPNSMKTGPGKQAGPPLTRPIQVNHPGNKPRNFDKMIAKKFDKIMKERLSALVGKYAQIFGG